MRGTIAAAWLLGVTAMAGTAGANDLFGHYTSGAPRQPAAGFAWGAMPPQVNSDWVPEPGAQIVGWTDGTPAGDADAPATGARRTSAVRQAPADAVVREYQGELPPTGGEAWVPPGPPTMGGPPAMGFAHPAETMTGGPCGGAQMPSEGCCELLWCDDHRRGLGDCWRHFWQTVRSLWPFSRDDEDCFECYPDCYGAGSDASMMSGEWSAPADAWSAAVVPGDTLAPSGAGSGPRGDAGGNLADQTRRSRTQRASAVAPARQRRATEEGVTREIPTVESRSVPSDEPAADDASAEDAPQGPSLGTEFVPSGSRQRDAGDDRAADPVT